MYCLLAHRDEDSGPAPSHDPHGGGTEGEKIPPDVLVTFTLLWPDTYQTQGRFILAHGFREILVHHNRKGMEEWLCLCQQEYKVAKAGG